MYQECGKVDSGMMARKKLRDNKPINSLAGSLGQILVGSPSCLGHFSQQLFARYAGR